MATTGGIAMTPSASARPMQRRTLAVVLVFVAVNLLMLWATVEGANLRYGGDAQSWYEPTVALYQHGAFVELHDPSKPQTYRGPVFPIFGAAMMLLATLIIQLRAQPTRKPASS